MTTITSRIKEYLTAKGVKNSTAEAAIGLGNGTLAKALNENKSIKTETLEKILSIYSDIDPYWLVSGEGKMLVQVNEPTPELLRSNSKRGIPLYNLEGSGGLAELIEKKPSTDDYISIPRAPLCDGATYIVGDHMSPILQAGDIVMYKEIKNLKNELFWGEMYLLTFEIAGNLYTMVKWIVKSEQGEDYVKLVSGNPQHEPKEIFLKSIKAAAIIKASIRMNAMS